MTSVLSVVIGVLLGLLSNVVANWLQPHLEKRKKHIIAVFITLAVTTVLLSTNILSSKKSGSSIQGNNITQKSDKMILVFCDLTPSQDTTAVKMVIKNSIKIIEACSNAELYFYPVSKNLYTQPLLHKPPSSRRIIERQHEINEYKSRISEAISAKYHSKDNSREESCIIGSLNVAYNKFQQDSIGYNKDLYLVFISDMMEFCTYDFGVLNLRTNSTYMAETNRIPDMRQDFDLAKLGVKIAVVMTAPKDLPIDERLHREFWKNVFKNVGYSDSAIQHIIFSSDLPSFVLSCE